MKKNKSKLSSMVLLSLLLIGCSKNIGETPPTHETTQNTTEYIAHEIVPTECSNESTQDNIVISKELERAMKYGIIPEAWADTLEHSITHKEFCELVSRYLGIIKPESLSTWQNLSSDAAGSDFIMGRDDGAVGIMYTAQAMDSLYTNISDYTDIHKVENHPGTWEFEASELWPELPEDFTIISHEPGTPMDSDFYQILGEDTSSTAFWFVLLRQSSITEHALFDWNEDYNLRMGEDMSRKDAIIALLRLAESEPNLIEGNRYRSVSDIGIYNSDIITDTLLNQSSDLPLPTQNSLTTEWRGMGIGQVKNGQNNYKDYSEGMFAFLKDHNINFCRIFFGFSSLRYPDYPEDLLQINETELVKLDQVIAWGIEYGIHIQLSMANTPNQGHSLDLNEKEWEAIREYWAMLARRYAGISNQYLSFDLLNELTPTENNLKKVADNMNIVVQAIREEDNDRILLISFNNNPLESWVECVGSMGVAFGSHPYYPIYLCEAKQNYYAQGQTCWPYPYFPGKLGTEESLVISGDLGNKILYLDFWCYEPFQITFDNGETLSITEKGDYIHEESCGFRFYEPYSIEIPENVTKLELKPIQNELTFQEIGIGSKDEITWLIVHDDMAFCDRGGADLIWKDDTGWSSENNCTPEYVYQRHIVPMLEISQKYNVGFMVNEVGSYAYNADFDIDVKKQYDSDMITMLEKNNISWCMCEMEYVATGLGHAYGWKNAETETKTYVFEDGSQQTFLYCPDLMEIYK